MRKLTLTILIIGIVFLSACATLPATPPSTPPTTPPTPPTPEEPEPQIIEVTAEQLYMAYKANQVTADAQFKGETLKVTGVVESMGKDATGTAYIVLSSSETNKTQMVKCLFSKGYGGEMVGVTTGDTVTIQGIGFGYVQYPIISECKLIAKK